MIPSSISPWLLPAVLAIGIAWLVRINIVTYRAFADDKARAMADQPRWPEVDLLNLASMGGSVGAMLAQRRLRHKTRKQPFAGQLRRIAVTQAILLALAAIGLLTLADPAEAAGSGFACASPSLSIGVQTGPTLEAYRRAKGDHWRFGGGACATIRMRSACRACGGGRA